ncbi:MAG: hypothetical protein HOY76_53385 [Streptomyces sp.]|nr:hypothetical protein [Streptomyces sp.]
MCSVSTPAPLAGSSIAGRCLYRLHDPLRARADRPELYLPLPCSWAQDAARCRAAAVPKGTGFATKPQLAAAMVARALDVGIPARW